MTDGNSLSVGDVVRVVAEATDQSSAAAILNYLAGDPQLIEHLSALPVPGEPLDGNLGTADAVIEFLVATSSALTAEAVVAIVRAAMQRRSAQEKNKAQIRVRLQTEGNGVIEVWIDDTSKS
jgi:hypothetical protein